MTDQEKIDFIIGPQVATGSWYDFTLLAQAKLHGEACPVDPPTDENGLNSFVLLHYYDLALSVYTAHARTKDATFLALGDKCADAWMKHPTWIGEGKIRKWPDEASPPPRHAGIGGLIIRALRGKDQYWDWMNSYTRYFFDLYVKRRLPSAPLYDLREGAFAFRFAIWLSQVLPHSFPLQNGGTETNGAQLRAQYLADVEAAAIQYWGRTQSADGSWRWNDDWSDSDGGSLVGVMQPFMVGLLLRALCDAHQVVGPTAKVSIEKQILNGCRHLYSGGPYIKDQIEQNSGKPVRGFHYVYHGGTTVNPTKYANGDIKFPWTAVEAWWLPSARQAISTILGPFGYAFKISGDPFFKTAGDELFDSAYSGSDGVRGMMVDTAKNFNQNVYASSYQAWAGAVAQPTPLPAPQPQPAPTTPTSPTQPAPTTPSPDGTRGSEIVDSTGGRWTLGSQKETLRDNKPMGGGRALATATEPYKYVSKEVYVLGTDSNWYKWASSGWSNAGATEPGGTVTQPEPQPAPTDPTPAPQPAPVPAPSRIVAWPSTESGQTALWQGQAKEGYRANKHVARPANMPKGQYVEFVKF